MLANRLIIFDKYPHVGGGDVCRKGELIRSFWFTFLGSKRLTPFAPDHNKPQQFAAPVWVGTWVASRTASFLAGLMLAAALSALAYGQALGPDAGDREKICVHGYSRSVRPPSYVTDAIKSSKAQEQGVDPRCCELNHIIPLCFGGAPLDAANLELQPWEEAIPEDEIEAHTCRDWCSGEIDFPTALARFKRTHP